MDDLRPAHGNPDYDVELWRGDESLGMVGLMDLPDEGEAAEVTFVFEGLPDPPPTHLIYRKRRYDLELPEEKGVQDRASGEFERGVWVVGRLVKAASRASRRGAIEFQREE